MTKKKTIEKKNQTADIETNGRVPAMLIVLFLDFIDLESSTLPFLSNLCCRT